MELESRPPVGGRQDMEALAESLRQAVGVFVRAVRGDAKTPGSSQHETLALLADGGSMTIAALAHLRQVKHQSMRLVLAGLERRRLVTSRDDAADRRSRSVAITDAGRAALSHERLSRTRVIADRMAEVLTGEEREILAAAVPLLERLCYAPGSGTGIRRLS